MCSWDDHDRQERRQQGAIVYYNAEQDADAEIRQVKYLNNIVEQDRRAIKRLASSMLGFKAFWSRAPVINPGTSRQNPQAASGLLPFPVFNDIKQEGDFAGAYRWRRQTTKWDSEEYGI
jgi:hypothetical protein